MILVGNQRGNGRELAHHLMKEDNERVIVHELRGFVAQTLKGAFQESEAISRATKCQQHLFSMSLNPPKGAEVSEAQFESAIEHAEERLGLSGQPRAIVFHEKIGRDGQLRRHAHAVWCRIDTENMRAIQLSHSRQKMQSLARELYVEHGWDLPRGFVSREFANPRNYTLAEWQQAKRARRDPEKLKAMFQDCWATSDSQAGLAHALRERGFVLARGDRRGVVAVDYQGEVYALARWVGVKTKVVRSRVSDADVLPDVRSAHQQAAEAVTDRLKGLHKETGRAARAQLSHFNSLKQALLDQHALAAKQLETAQEKRALAEQAAREAKFRRGWRGLLDRVTGRHNRMRSQNAAEQAEALQRDQSEKRRQIAQHSNEASQVADDISATRKGAKATLSELREDFRSITNGITEQEAQDSSSPRRRRRRDRRRWGPN